MRVGSSSALALSLPILAGCALEPRGSAPIAPAVLGPRASLRLPEGELGYGSLVRAVVRVGNAGVNPCLIRAVDLPGQLPDPVAWLALRPGSLRPDRGRGGYVWRQRDPGWTPAVFAAGLLHPGEWLEFERAFRVRGAVQEVIVRFQEVPAAEAVEHLLLPVLTRTPPSRRESRAHFAPATVSSQSAFRLARPLSDERLAVVTDPGQWLLQERRSVEEVVHPGARVAAEGVAREILDGLGHPGAELSRWDTGHAWLVRDPAEGSLLLYREGDAEPERFPPIEFAVFDLADLSVREGSELWLQTTDSGEEFLQIEPSRLLQVLRDARKRGLRPVVEAVDLVGHERVLAIVLR